MIVIIWKYGQDQLESNLSKMWTVYYWLNFCAFVLRYVMYYAFKFTDEFLGNVGILTWNATHIRSSRRQSMHPKRSIEQWLFSCLFVNIFSSLLCWCTLPSLTVCEIHLANLGNLANLVAGMFALFCHCYLLSHESVSLTSQTIQTNRTTTLCT